MSRFQDLICHIKIRQLLLMVLGLLSAIAIAAIGWNSIGVIRQHQAASNLSLITLLSDKSLQLTTELAIERGLTSTLLATRKKPDVEQLLRLKRQRQRSDQRYTEFSNLLFRYHKPAGTEPLNRAYEAIQPLRHKLAKLRGEVDHFFRGRPDPNIPRHWYSRITDKIEAIASLQQAIMAPIYNSNHTAGYGQLLHEMFFSLSESAGQERATLGRAIAIGKPMTADELTQLRQYRSIIRFSEKKIFEALAFYPKTPEIQAATKRYREIFRGSYEQLRQQILEAAQAGMAYPITQIVWFSEASRAIDTITELSQAVSLQNSQDIAATQKRANQTVVALMTTILLVFIAFVATYLITYRRILSPLTLLEQAAKTIEQGDLKKPVKINTKDEFGHLGQGFESMRVSLLNDREHRELVEQELRKLHQAIEQSVSSMIITNSQGVTEYVNHRFELTTGFRQEEVIGRKFNQLRSGKTPPKVYKEMWKTIKSGDIWEGELLNRKKSGELYWELVSISPVRDKLGEISHFIGVQHDITQRKALEERLNYLAYHDELTGLPNRTLLLDRFNQLTSHSKRHSKQIALMMLDLNRFKLINDSLGHETGDQVLVEIGRRLQMLARTGDTVARYGGDEFVLLLPEIQSATVVTEIARRINQKVNKPLELKERILHVSCSIGVALWPQDGNKLDNLLSNADAAMYQAKSRSGNKLQFFTEELNNQVQQRMEMENDLRNAYARGELELYYQPQFNLVSNRITGMEALLRWHHPKYGMISPDRFIPLAEETGLILPIGEWVIEQACLQARRFHKQGYPDLVMAINVSVRQLEGQDITDIIQRAIDRASISPSSLEIEITESVMMEEPERMIESLTNLKRLGIRLALDDFGTGHSSLSYLQRFPFDKLKIDRTFIHNITQSADDAAIAMTIGAMAKSLKLALIAEGVETEEQMEFLKHCGCHEIQGYLISKPIPAIDFQRLLQSQHMITA